MILLWFAKKIKFLAVLEVRPNLGKFRAKIYKGFAKFIKEKYFHMYFLFYSLNSFFRQNWLRRLESWGPDASLDTYMDGLGQLWCLWQLWTYGHIGHMAIVAVVAIDAIVDRDHWYGCLIKCLDLRIAVSEADFA